MIKCIFIIHCKGGDYHYLYNEETESETYGLNVFHSKFLENALKIKKESEILINNVKYDIIHCYENYNIELVSELFDKVFNSRAYNSLKNISATYINTLMYFNENRVNDDLIRYYMSYAKDSKGGIIKNLNDNKTILLNISNIFPNIHDILKEYDIGFNVHNHKYEYMIGNFADKYLNKYNFYEQKLKYSN